jgi:hypothetical protein
VRLLLRTKGCVEGKNLNRFLFGTGVVGFQFFFFVCTYWAMRIKK